DGDALTATVITPITQLIVTATVNSDNTLHVSAISEGTTTITLEVSDGRRTVFVAIPVVITALAPTLTALDYQPNVTVTSSTYQLSLSARYSDNTTVNLTGTELSWSSSDQAIATVSATGLVTAKSIGSTVVSVTYGGLQANYQVTIDASAKVSAPTASPASGTVTEGTAVSLSTSTTGATIRYTTD